MKDILKIVQAVLSLLLVVNLITFQAFVWFPAVRPDSLSYSSVTILAAIYGVGLALLVTRKDWHL